MTAPEPPVTADHTPEGHRPKPDGSCSLLCSCPTPLTQAEADLLGDLGVF